ncbi:biosynthetic-type acetolactate synthase large subunit [Dethiosulfatarculus sandiegensis]|uniref:Acetolactate synthase n=1 Tax=Dethiosulfatarculus sandiegensis TaxID=1429043 RepID=A0A0D2J9Q5_9BACT|nr:biosynthetic-type acetolactate synthase large subunit [Dethiosulfatarculus sandiegensis]KIX12416.1 acetolactate synthase [Dethiosulfatarculus sandiegensis]
MGIPAQKLSHNRPVSEPTTADRLVRFLGDKKVPMVFGMTGAAIMPVYDALFKVGSPRHIISGHEQGAAHMAEGLAKVTGRAGVVMATSGPGATNLVTGLADAMMDSVPLVAITGQVNKGLMGKDAFQEADIEGITMPVTKHNYQVKSPEHLSQVLREAFYVAENGRPGPVLIDLPRDIVVSPCPPISAEPLQVAPPARQKPGFAELNQALMLMRKAKRPVILAGGGVITARASRELKDLASAWNAPVACTLMGLGSFPSEDGLSLGMPGMHGSGYANLAIYESDLLLVAGARLDDRVTGRKDGFAPFAKLVHLDVDPSEINKILPAQVSLEADAKPALAGLFRGVMNWEERPDLSPWHERINELKRLYPQPRPKTRGLITPQQVIKAWADILNPEAVIVTGVGQHQMFTAQHYPFSRPGTLITSGGLGVMGFGLPAALGAKLGAPDKDVILMDGDGSFLMNIQELATAVRYGIGCVATIFNNSGLGMVRQWQTLFYNDRRAATEFTPPAFDQVARAFGALGRKVKRPEELEASLAWALKASREKHLPVVLDVDVDPETLVYPMVPQGGKNADFITGAKGGNHGEA